MQITQKLFLIALMCATVYAQKGGGTVVDPYAGLPPKPTAEWLATQPDYNPNCQLNKFKPEEQFEKKEWICHGTASETNPYVLIHVAKSSLWKGHFDGGAPGHGKKNHDDIWPNTIGYDGVFYDCNCERPAVVPPPVTETSSTVYLPREFVLTVGDTEGKEPENPADASKVTLIVTIAEKTVTAGDGEESCYGESFRVNTLKVYGLPTGSTCQYKNLCCDDDPKLGYIQFSGTSNTTVDPFNTPINGQVVDCLGNALTIVLPTNEDQFHGKIEYSVTAEIVTVTTKCPCDACSPSDSGVGHVIPLNDAPTIVFEGPANHEFGQSAPLFTSIAVKDADYYSAANTCPRIIRVRLSSESLWLGFKNGDGSEVGPKGWNLFVRDTEGTYREVLVPVVDWTYSGSQKCGDKLATGITCLDGEAAPNNAFSAIAVEIEYSQLNALLADVHYLAMENFAGPASVTLTVDDKIHTHTAYDKDGAEVTRGCDGFIGYEGEDVYEGSGRAWGVCPAAGCAAATVVVPVNVLCRDVSGAGACDVGAVNRHCSGHVWWMVDERVTQKNAYTKCTTLNQTTTKTPKLQICHGPAAEKNPYNLLEVDANSAHGHLKRVITDTCFRKNEALKRFAAYKGYTERLEWIPEVLKCRATAAIPKTGQVKWDTTPQDECWRALSATLTVAQDGYTPQAEGFDLAASLETCCEDWTTKQGINADGGKWCDINFMDDSHGKDNAFDTCPGGLAYRATGLFTDIIEYPYTATQGTAFVPVWGGPTGGYTNCLCEASVANSAKFLRFMNGKHMGSGAVTNATKDLDWHEAPANAVNEGAANNLADNGVEKEDEEANNNAAGNSVSMSLPVFVVAVVAIAGVIGVLAVALLVTRRRKAPSTGYNAEVPAPVVQRTAKAWDRGSAMEVTHLTDVCASGDVEHPFEDTNATGLRPFEPNASLSHAFMKDVEDDA